MLRKMLEQEFNVDLKPQKALIRSEIEKYLEQLEEQPAEQENDQNVNVDEREDSAEPTARKRKRGSRGAAAFGDVLSEAMAAFLEMDRCPRTQVVKKLWEYIKANDLQDPKDRRRIILDDKLKTIFPGKSVNMLSMQKHLSKHVFIASDLGLTDDEDSEDEDIKTVTPKRAAKNSTSNKEGRKANGFTKPLKLSQELAAWMGKDTASRPEITKHLWSYVKEKNLQDPGNKQYVIADDTLLSLTGQRRFLAFSFQKLLTNQILGYVE